MNDTNLTFAEALDLVTSKIAETEGKEYDGIIVKKLMASNTLDPNRDNTKQTHIAITGKQIDIFPYLNAAGYFDPNFEEKDDSLKSFFLLQAPVRLYRKNVENVITDKTSLSSIFSSDKQIQEVYVSVQGSRRKDQADQVQFSLISHDSPEFVNFRRQLEKDATMVLLKCDKEFKYDLFAFKSNSVEANAFNALNSNFYKKDNSVTKVNPQLFLRIDDNKTTIPDNLTEDQLADILKYMVDTKPGYAVCAYHSFGIIYGNYIRKKDYKIATILKKAGLNDSFSIEEAKGNKLRDSFEKNIFGISIYREDNQSKKIVDAESRVSGGQNILLYGVPGSGKSHYINTKYCCNQDFIERVVFHPEYTYSDFIGQILPQIVEDKINYVFTPGPFTTILKKAIYNPTQNFFLVIEELNRGNAPAIFGEIFQLLDRNKTGESVYSITNFDIAKELFKNPEQKIKLPSNLWILATMNTSDQNVFTLDTAFQRRWQMKHIRNDISSSTFAKNAIANSGITWEAFALKVNSLIIKCNDGASSTEDKRIGAYFVSENELNNKELFAEKVLKYLWDDAFKLDRGLFFKDSLTSFDEVLENFNSETNFFKEVVREDIYNSLTISDNQNIKSTIDKTNEK